MISTNDMTKIDVLWNTLQNNGMTDSLVNIEQISYLIFFKRIDTVQTKREQMAAFWEIEVTDPIFDILHDDCRWSRFKTYSAGKLFRHMTDKVFPFVRYNINITDETAYAHYMRDAAFRFSNPETLRAAVDVIDELDFDSADTAKENYEYFLTKITPNADKGQITTPDFIVNLMVRLTAPTMEDRICDPAMGNANLLAAAARYVHEHDQQKLIDQNILKYYSSEMFSGMDIDHQMVSIAAMTMVLSDIPNANLQRMDSLSENNFSSGEYSLILSGPPFSVTKDINYVSESLQSGYSTANTAVLFFRLIMRMLKPEGRCAVLVPDVLLFGVHKANMALKQDLIAGHRIDAIISLANLNRQDLGRVSCSLLLFTKDIPDGTNRVWFYDLTDINDIPDLINRYTHKELDENRSRFEHSFFVSREEIEANNFMLIMNRYRKAAGLADHMSADMAMRDLEIANSILRRQIYRLEEV